MYREILRLYQEDKKISYHYHLSPYIMIKKFVPHPFWSFCRVVAKACYHQQFIASDIASDVAGTLLATVQFFSYTLFYTLECCQQPKMFSL